MKKFSWVFFWLLAHGIVSVYVVCNDSEFVQPRKKRRTESLDSLRKQNVEVSADIFSMSSDLITCIAQFQKEFQDTIMAVAQTNNKKYQEETGEKLAEIVDAMRQVQELVETCRIDAGKTAKNN